MNEFDNNDIIEINNDSEENVEVKQDISKNEYIPLDKVSKKEKISLKEKWNGLSKKKKIIIISSCILILLIILVCLGLVLLKKDKEEVVEEETVILEKDNYRYENGKLLFLDKNDKVIGEYECTTKDPDKCFVMKLDYSKDQIERAKSINESGDEIVKSSQIYEDNFVFVSDGKESNLYNIKNNKKELKVNGIKTYGTEKNLVVLEDEDGKYGLIEINSEEFNYLIRPSYDNLSVVNTKLVYLVALDKEKTYLIDSEGKKISDNISGTINSANEKFIVVVKNDKYNLYSLKNEELLSGYNYIGLYDDVIALVNNNRLYLRDNELNKLDEEGFRLKNSYYIKEYVYDNDNKLKETHKAFEIVKKDNNIMVTIDDEIKNVNTLEGIISSKLNYLSYFDGKLYFYNDEEKDNLLGTYTCKNKNTISSSDSSLDKCNILITDDGYTGIYNNNIVIILDNYSKDEIVYTIYSLKEKKVKGTYSYIEVVNKEEVTSNIEHIGSNASFLIAQTDTGNNKGNYGVLEINSEKIAGKIGFLYKEIKKDGNYYVLKDKNDTYGIYNMSFSKIGEGYNYIKLYENHYIGIINNKLNLYSYLGSKVLDNDLDVSDNKYEISFENGIKIVIGDKEYNYTSSGKLIVPEVEENTEVNNSDEGDNNEV